MTIIRDDELMHYGVLGMKWGVRRYQNKDGTLTNAGKKRLATSIKKQYPRKVTNDAYKQIKQDIADELRDNYKSQLQSHIKTIREKKEFLDKVWSINDEYYDKEYSNDTQRAYDKTYEYLKKNNPDYLNTIIKENDGDKDTLDRYHDFRKIHEGFEDEIMSEGMTRVYNKYGIDSESANNAYGDYMKACKSAADSVVGVYGNMKLPKEYSYQDNTNVQKIVAESMKQLVEDPWISEVSNLKKGSKVEGTITRITPFGAFVQISPAVEALVHVSELGEGSDVDPEKIFTLNERKSFKVLDIDKEGRKISLSIAK